MSVAQIVLCLFSAIAAALAWVACARARAGRPAYERQQAEDISRLLAKLEGDLEMARGAHSRVLKHLVDRVAYLERQAAEADAGEISLQARIAALEGTRPAEQ